MKAITQHLDGEQSCAIARERLGEDEDVHYDMLGVTSLWDIHVMLIMRRDLKNRVKVWCAT